MMAVIASEPMVVQNSRGMILNVIRHATLNHAIGTTALVIALLVVQLQ